MNLRACSSKVFDVWVNNRGGSGTATGTTSWSATNVSLQAGSNVVTVTVRDAAGNTAADVLTVTLNGGPTVMVTAPVNAASVSGTVTVTATASTGVAGVQFLLDGSPLGTEDTSAPYSASWNTTTVSAGTYQLAARARDAAGYQATSAAISVTVTNTVGGLVAAYGFNEGTGATALNASGATLSGTISGATWVAQGKFGKALSFDGVNDWVTLVQ